METTKHIKVDVTKDFPVPVSRLYQAWIQPEELKQWWHPMGNHLQHAYTKPEAGGRIEYAFTNDEGKHPFTITGTYKEAEEKKRLVYTWKWQLAAAAVDDSEFLLTVTFLEAGEGSQLSVTQENFTSEEALQPHREGWEKALNELHQYLSQS